MMVDGNFAVSSDSVYMLFYLRVKFLMVVCSLGRIPEDACENRFEVSNEVREALTAVMLLIPMNKFVSFDC